MKPPSYITEKLIVSSERIDEVLPSYYSIHELKDGASPAQFNEIINKASEEDFAIYFLRKGIFRPEFGTKNKRDRDGSWMYLPSTPETVAHLKLLKAFEVMKNTVQSPSESCEYNEKCWQVFVTNAVRRFIVFVSCLRPQSKGGQPRPLYFPTLEYRIFEESVKDYDNVVFEGFLPPLDVLMVWHSLLLNPRLCYDALMRMHFIEFSSYPFPFERVANAIDDYTFVYNPSEDMVKNYMGKIQPFVAKSDVQLDDLHVFHVHGKFEMNSYLVDIRCPVCSKTLVSTIPYTNQEGTGFADSKFCQPKSSTGCECRFPSLITRDELCKRQLFADVRSSEYPTYNFLPGTLKIYSEILQTNFPQIVFKHDDFREDMLHAMQFANRELGIADLIKDLLEVSEVQKMTHFPAIVRVLRGYLFHNLVHLTVNSTAIPVIEFHEDLVGCVLRQGRFVDKMNKFNWISSNALYEIIRESRQRYMRFFQLMTLVSSMLVPTLDIDLVWHTHQLRGNLYFKACWNSKRASVIDHDDKIDLSRLDDGFERTSRLYRRSFGKEYLICLCWYCLRHRSKSKNVLSRVLSRRPTPYKGYCDPTHLSTHNTITLPSVQCLKDRQSKAKAYGKTEDEMPWRDDEKKYGASNPGLYAIPPSMPITDDCGVLFKGSCCSLKSGTCSSIGGAGCAGPHSQHPSKYYSSPCGGSSACGGGG